MPKITQSTVNPDTLFSLNGLDYKKDVYEVFYLNKEVDKGSKDIKLGNIRIGLRSVHYPSNILQNPVTVGEWLDGSETPYSTFNDLLSDLSDLVGFNSGGGVGSVITVTQQVVNYAALVDGNEIGEMAYVENSQGTSWLPYTLGGTYYPSGFYLWDGTNWVSDRNAIANQLEQSILNIDSKLDKSTAVTTERQFYVKNPDGTQALLDESFISGGGTPNPKTILHDSTFPVHTGVTGATIVKTITIPANTIPANCYFRLLVTMKWTKSANYKYFYITMDSNNTNLRRVVNYIATSTNNAAVDLQTVTRNCYIKNGVMHVTNTAHFRSDYTVSDDEEIPFDVTQDHEISYWCNVADTADEMEILGTTIEVIY